MAESNIEQILRTSEESIQSWLIARIAAYLKQPPGEIDPGAPLLEHGMDSMSAFSLCADIEDELGVLVEPVVLWEIDTVTALTTYIVGRAVGESSH